MKCQAIVEDYENGTHNNLRRVIITPKNRPCLRGATVQLGHLCLCAQHGRLAAEGLVDGNGHVAPRGDLRAVRDNPRHFPLGLYAWAQGQAVVPLKSPSTKKAEGQSAQEHRFRVGQRVQFNGVAAKVIAVSSKGDWVQVVHDNIATKLSRAEARRQVKS